MGSGRGGGVLEWMGGWWGGGLLGRVVPPACQFSSSACSPVSPSELHPSPASRRRYELFGAAAIRKVGNKGEEREVKKCVCDDGDAQKPAEGPREGFAGFRRDDFGELQARGKESDEQRGNLRLDGHGDSQSRKPGKHSPGGDQHETEQLGLRHVGRL